MKTKHIPRVVVITGASAGLGRAIAQAFGREKANVGLISRGVEGLEAARSEIEKMGGQALVLVADVGDSAQVEAAAKKVEEHFGPIDVWVNNAMVSVFSPVKEMKPEEYKRVTDVTYLGYVYGTLAALKTMLPRNQGIIIQVGSALAIRSIPLQSAYCAAKHALKGFTESLRTELLHDKSKVQVCLAEMPAMNTPQFGWVKSRLHYKPQPVPPIYQPEVGASAVVYLSRHPRRELLVGYPTWIAVLGEKFAPGFADHYLAKNGFRSQQTDEPEDPMRPNNLWASVPGDHGSHGRVDSRARSSSLELKIEFLHPGRWLFGIMTLTFIYFVWALMKGWM
jgi:NAD(P)-dependent dehydrogenase (short-subunit alcohol dehydrogenase family)